MANRVLLVVIVSFSVPMACGGGGGDSPLSVRGTWETYVRVDCAKGHECRASYPGAPADFEYDYGATLADCLSELQSTDFEDTVRAYEDAVTHGRTVYDAASARTCFDAWGALGCAAYWQGDESSPACDGIFVGHVVTGGACTLGDECVSGACFGPAGATTCT